ncbi:phosphoglycerate mutase-like protein [Pleomassaria siparia CBS 279.74]|uniref:Phosphoglycerate mutase-like protein n=1 Tax=Pleomassaria siparia CBS 279.74 TaxID=1314801 RepID=A0A6G1JXE9_9PLEO|nr:phosphoglycerate mutase-like protein [Pleomassaria siparia CBS 279.74]
MHLPTITVGAFLALTSLASALYHRPTPPKTHVNYTVVPDIFLQDDPSTVASGFNFTAVNFGLINRAYPTDDDDDDDKTTTHNNNSLSKSTSQWQRLATYINSLNSQCSSNERYTLLFLGRHGEGYHNAAETYLGTPAWNCYWSERDGNGTVTWADAHLTPTGVAQALSVHAFWAHLIHVEHMTPPQTYYVSPLYRCLDTARLTFDGLELPRGSPPFVPTVKELFREGISAHTCDRRSNRTYIHEQFPSYRFEPGFAEQDPYWTALLAETSADQDRRSKTVLDDVFTTDGSEYISVTAHSGEIASLLRVLGHRVFALSTGAAIPVLVKATTLKGHGPATTTQPYTAQKTCAVPPTIRDSTCNDCSCCT